MKRFLIKVLFAAVFALLVPVCVIVCRIALAQRVVDEAFDVPPGTQVVFIGNSHTGCTWTEAPEFRNRVVWCSATGFMFHYLRFREVERQGALDRGVKVCVLDCDSSALNRFTKDTLVQNALAALSYLWRYLPLLPFQKLAIVREALLHPNCTYALAEEPKGEVPDWTTRTKEEKESYLKRFYTPAGILETQWDSDAFPRDWQNRFYEMVADMKARCDKRGIRLILFAAPLASQYPDRNDPLIYRRISSVAEKIRSMGIEYYDYRAACPDNKFRDAGHLLRSSAYEFTKKFYAEVLKLPVGK